ncbi:MAG TPA: hypothetical protein VMU53_15790 [Candidatus Sulfotelmatobacter sp.]|nr:hypothetical protein [Candidatus Sulfotelmatobacter sp.]
MKGAPRRIIPLGLLLLASAGWCARAARADEIRLKDGKKLYGVIVGYEDNMFKVKTDFGYVLVEKDKIASIIPDSPAGSTSTKPEANAKPSESSEVKPAVEPTPKEKAAAMLTNSNVRPAIPAVSKTTTDAKAPVLKATAASPKATLVTTSAPPPPPAEAPPANSEEIQGNLYINHSFAFRMYKAPSWQIIAGAGQTLPNAIVAMGTSNESTLLVVGHEKSKEPLEATAQTVEKRMHDVYDNYRLISQRKTVLGGQPAIEYRYQGMADDHDWSGTLSVVAHNGEYLTVLGMTFADDDLIQIQENVINRAIASLDFNVK